MFTELLNTEGDADSLAVTNDAPVLSTMQMLLISAEAADSECSSGLLIQSPLDSIPAIMHVNAVEIDLQGTLLLLLDGDLSAQLIEGTASLTNDEVSYALIAGSAMSFTLDEDNLAAGANGSILSYDADSVVELALPLDQLARPVELAEPLTVAELDSLLTCIISTSVNANLRQGPSTLFPETAVLEAGESAAVIGQTNGIEGMIWWQLDEDAWVRADVVDAGLNCDSVAIGEAPALPTPDTASPQGTLFWIGNCEFPPQVAAGDLVSLWLGTGSNQTIAEAQQSISGFVGGASLTVDGQPLQTRLEVHTWGVGDYGVRVIANWIATAGSHSASGSLGDTTSVSCQFNVVGAG
jgi:hypothetical protein